MPTKNTACKVYSLLAKAAANREYVNMYHASLTSDTKGKLYSDFKGQTQLCCLVATVAFGMVSVVSIKIISLFFLGCWNLGDGYS